MPKRLTPQEKILRAITEAELQRTVIAILHRHGYIVFHDSNSMVGMHRAGFPDIVAVRKESPDFFMAELKRETGQLRPEQVVWHDYLRTAGVDVFLWRPSDLQAIEVITRPGSGMR